MKKLIISIIAIALGAAAYAKTLDELTSEFKSLSSWAEQIAWAGQNSDDLKTAWAAQKSQPAFFANGAGAAQAAMASMEKQERETVSAQMKMFAYFYAQLGESFEASDVQKAAVNAARFFANNPDKLASAKSADWTIDGYKLPSHAIINTAFTLKDANLLYEMRNSFSVLGGSGLAGRIADVRRLLLEMPDIEKAKEICNAYENAMLICNAPRLEEIQAVGKTLTARILDSKISK